MPHDNRPMMNPQPICTFYQLYNSLDQMPNRQVSLVSTGGKDFIAEARITREGGRVIVILPNKARIFPCCWGNTENHYGTEKGTRIRLYAKPLDEWASNL